MSRLVDVDELKHELKWLEEYDSPVYHDVASTIDERATVDTETVVRCADGEKGEKMPIKGENGGYKYKAFINGEWHDLTLSDSPNELTEWLQSNEEWTRVKHGHWIGKPIAGYSTVRCSECGDVFMENSGKWNYCPNCGAKMDGERREDDSK